MTVSNIVDIVVSIDARIAELTRARALLAGTEASSGTHAATKKKPRKRVMSAAARERMAEAQKKRWAAAKKAAK